MKKTLIALAAVSAFAGVAQAQSVTVYGLLDANVQSLTTNVAVGTTFRSLSRTTVDSGGLNGSRWGLRGTEDLGGGLSATFQLESGINLDAGSSGQGGLLFGRRAVVGLSSKGMGTFLIGRNTSPLEDVSGDGGAPGLANNGYTTASIANNGLAPAATLAATGFLTRGNNATSWIGYTPRFNNSLKYTTPNMGGFTASAMYALGEDKTVATDGSETIGLNAKYVAGPLVVSAAYQSHGTTPTATLKPKLESTMVSVAYDLGVARLGAAFGRSSFTDVTVTALKIGNVAATAKDPSNNEYLFSVSMPMGAFTLGAEYAQSQGDALGTSRGFAVQGMYSLSKRTTLYTGYGSTDMFDNILVGAGSDVNKSTALNAGLRHTF